MASVESPDESAPLPFGPVPAGHEEMDSDQRKKSQQKAERALLGWHACQEHERSSKMSYLNQRVQLQRDLIAKSDLLTEKLRDKHDSQRRKSNESKKKWRREQIEAVRAKEKRIQKRRQKTMEMREKEEEEEEEVVEGEAMYMVPLEEGEDEGSGSQQELMVQSSGPHAAQTDTPDTTSSKISNGRIANPKLNRLIRACKGNVAIETMWSKLKQENEKKASQLEQKCLSLRDDEMSPFLKQCLVTFDLPYTLRSKFIWDDIRIKQQSGRESQRRHSFPPIDEPLPRASTSEGRRLVNLMFCAALENEYNASAMLARKQFRHSVIEGSVNNLIPEDALRPIGALLMQLREKERIRLESRGNAKKPSRMIVTSSANAEKEEGVDACVPKSAIFVASNEVAHSPKVRESEQTHLPVIVEEPAGALLPLPSPKEGCVRTWSSQSVKRHGTVLSARDRRKKSTDSMEPQEKGRHWEPLNLTALSEDKQLRVYESKFSSPSGKGGYSHGAPKLWKAPV